jgi:hypothetical protein
MLKIINGFVVFAVQPGASRLLLPSLRWVSSNLKAFDSYDWRYGLEESVIEFLRVCWQRHSEQIVRNSSHKEHFLDLLTIVASRGSHAAITLSAQVSGSLDR